MAILSKFRRTILVLLIVFILSFLIFFYFFEKERKQVITGKLTQEQEMELQERASEIIKTNDFGKCQEIENEMYRTVCINNIALNLAREKQDVSYCQKLDDKLISVAGCERGIVLNKSLEKEDINICLEAENNEIKKECQESFWQNLAFKKGDIRFCDNISDEEKKIFCRDSYLFGAEFVKSASGFDCEKFQLLEAESDCRIYKENISAKKDADCKVFKSNLFLNYCLLSVKTR